MSYVHLLAGVTGRKVITLCGMVGSGFATTNRYQGASCGKCRREYLANGGK